MIRSAWEWLVSALFTSSCLVCGREGDWLCKNHQALAPPPRSQADFEYLDDIWAATAYYVSPGSLVVEHFKYHGVRSLSLLMAQAMFLALPKGLPPCTVVPIPLHWTRYFWRGYNQASSLSREISQRLKYPELRGLKRFKKTKQQARLDRSERLKNLSGVFVWQSSEVPDRVLLIDDVVATGATLDQAARVLKEAGVSWVGAVVFARGGASDVSQSSR
jgi:ComF family protein